jgi:acetoacetate decarboxylase
VTTYPPAPWHLNGSSIQALRLVEIERVQDSIPAALRIVSVRPGKTLGVVYCARYESGSTLSYHELIVASALVSVHGALGFWIAQIYVDDRHSQAGGQAIWGLPKQLARFHWTAAQGSAAVEQDDAPIAKFEWQPEQSRIPAPLWLPVISRRESRLIRFRGTGHCALALTRGRLFAPANSLLHTLGFDDTRRFAFARHLRLTIKSPTALC